MTVYGSHKKLPIIFVRGFGGLDIKEEKNLAYQGFNRGTIYYHKRGDGHIYEGMALRLIKEEKYLDATNLVGFYPNEVDFTSLLENENYLNTLNPEYLQGRTILQLEQVAAFQNNQIDSFDPEILWRSLWVYRYYNYACRDFTLYARELYKLIRIILDVTGAPAVNIVAHSVGGLVVRSALHGIIPQEYREQFINKVVTLGTPHKGIHFQLLPDAFQFFAVKEESNWFNPIQQADETDRYSYKNYSESLKARTLCIIGTDHKSYDPAITSSLNRFFAEEGHSGLEYNKSDGLVRQKDAYIDGAFIAYIHKCHGGRDSIVSSRESYEIVSRFLFGDHRLHLRYLGGIIHANNPWTGKSEYFLGASIKPRAIDFELFHQSNEAENCFGPFLDKYFSKPYPNANEFGEDNLLLTTFLSSSKIKGDKNEIVLRLNFYIGERDSIGTGFSDEVILNKQYYIQIDLTEMKVYFHTTGFDYRKGVECKKSSALQNTFLLELREDVFEGNFSLQLEKVGMEEAVTIL